MHPYRTYVEEFARLAGLGAGLPLGGLDPLPAPALAADAPKVLLFSPHPDDECIVGLLALRLMREAGHRVVNVAVTLGSNPARQAARLAELRQACAFLGFGLVQTTPTGLEQVNPASRARDPVAWAEKVRRIADILRAERPRILFFPHDRDWNSTHVGVHALVTDALRLVGPAWEGFTVETEFWGQCDDPNAAVEARAEDLADLVAACSFHVGEVRRNPYHLLLPAWMMDNVRRGGELVGGQGGAAPTFLFATLYRVRRWKGGQWERFYPGGRMLSVRQPAGELFA